MQILKIKSLSREIPDNNIEKEYVSTRFISFESAINMFEKLYPEINRIDKPIGYRITEQGIEMLYK